MANIDDFKNVKGKWVQRNWKGSWTISGILWNNVKERCTVEGATQRKLPAYIGCTNSFIDFQDFANWHVNQVGYGLGYELDADILRMGSKCYSRNTCVLIPANLNKFIQSSRGRRGVWPQGVSVDSGKLLVQIKSNGVLSRLGTFYIDDVDAAIALYTSAKNTAGTAWYNRLLSGEFTVDDRVIEYMKNWKHVCDWKPNGQI